MSTDEQATRASGSVPHAYGNALAWRWSREMPTALRRGFLTLLYALRAIANANGELRFHGDHKPIRIQDIAKAAGADEKDARRYMNAGIAAGVVAVKGEQRRGKATLYTLVLCPIPDWGAAEDVLKTTRRKPGKGSAPWQAPAGSSGDRDPNQFGGPRPELPGDPGEEVRGTAPRMGSGDRAPNGSGDRAPNNPGGTHVSPHDEAGVVFKPQVVGPPAPQQTDSDQEQNHVPTRQVGFLRCTRCHERLIPDPRRPERTTHSHCTERTAS
ncbi:hypothetical protein [Streptomyces sp.]|uniref:hypothetical protein n=1 Tax=Streptomyces sp. TaxID=1931 RepID=UPI002F94AF79